MYQRSTTATRREARIANTRWLHISQAYTKTDTLDPVTGVVTETLVPLYPRGRTYDVGANKMRRGCRALGLNRSQIMQGGAL